MFLNTGTAEGFGWYAARECTIQRIRVRCKAHLQLEGWIDLELAIGVVGGRISCAIDETNLWANYEPYFAAGLGFG